MSFSRSDFSAVVFKRMRKASTPRRYQLMLQILLIFVIRDMDPSVAKNILRLIWASIPDSIIIFPEIENALKNDLSLEEIKDIYNFYIEAVSIEAPKLSKPRTLKQLCRTMIRSRLCKNDLWLPSAINKLYIPLTLKGFLNLDD
ncbi:hypothetical protein AVEN_147236-1 [Araneus ventricosus]|uniref:SOCS box domain-containing protein n=1 Tax=Araneus ventricosus TaxID=182803 RepID=A0A4Y2PRT3_ARAVE|nr:hypothetical protein AVEN_147236-1 [Araneus ventricosus]